MRFQKFMTTFFHRRTRSDPGMARLTTPPIATPKTRPLSESSIVPEIPVLPLPPSQSIADILIPMAPLSPFELSAPFSSPGLPSQPPQALSLAAAHPHSNPLGQEPPAATPGPARSGHARQVAPKPAHEAGASIARLEAALKTERIAREVAEEACAEYALKVVALEHEVVQLRRSLFTSVTAPQPEPDRSFDSIMDDSIAGYRDRVAENTAIVAERDRLRRFVELVVSVGGHKPVLDAAYQRVVGRGDKAKAEGQDPEVALVAAIKDAVQQPGSAWAGLIEPVTGARTPEEYLAQVRCTLDARKQTMDWRKRAKFWKGKAKEGGQNGSTVTPSVSALSTVTVRGERKEKIVEAFGSGRSEGSAPLRILDVAIPQADFGEGSVGLTPTASHKFILEMVAHWTADSPGAAFESSLPAISSSMVLPTARPTSFHADQSGPLAILPSPGSRDTISSSSTRTSLRFRRWDAELRHSTDSARSSGSSTQEAVQVSAVSEGSTAVATPVAGSSPHHKETPGSGKRFDRDLALALRTNDLADITYHPVQARALTMTMDAAESEESPTRSAVSSPEKKSRLPVRMRGLGVIKRLSTTFAISRNVVTEAKQATGGAALAQPGRAQEEAFGVALSVAPDKTGVSSGGVPRQTKIPMGRKPRRFAS